MNLDIMEEYQEYEHLLPLLVIELIFMYFYNKICGD